MQSNATSGKEYSGIHFFNESGLTLPFDSATATRLAQLVEEHEDCRFKLLEITFVKKAEIVRINREYLNHNYVTDTISFRYDEEAGNHQIEGTLYCCAAQILEQAEELKEVPKKEFARILIHGMLHLRGYDDQSEIAKKEMRTRENFYLKRLKE